MIELAGICRSYRLGDETIHALIDVEEVIRDGEHVAIIGPSGSGKSTLLNVIGCLDRPTGGSYLLDGREVASLDGTELSAIRRHHFGFVFQSYHLVARLDAAANVELPMVFAGIARDERRRRVEEMLDAVGMMPRARHRPDQLSGGERQRIAIARACVMGPRVLLADEPTGNLDTRSGDQILDLLDRRHREGLTLVVVTHDPAVARRADRVLVMTDGRIVRRMAGRDVTSLSDAFGTSAPAP